MNHDADTGYNPVSSLDVRSKLALFLQLMVWSFLFDRPVCHLIMGIIVISLGLGMGLSFKRMFSRLIPLLPIFIMIVIFTGFTGSDDFLHEENRAALFTIWTKFTVTRGGLLLGFTFLLRLTNMVVLTFVIIESTPLDDFINLFMKLKFPHSLSFVITTALRFVPELDKKRNLIINAQRARGIDMDEGGWFRNFKNRFSIMIPLIINSIVMAEQLSMGLLNRGFGYKKSWTILSDLKLNTRDYLILILCLLGIISGILMKFHGNWGVL